MLKYIPIFFLLICTKIHAQLRFQKLAITHTDINLYIPKPADQQIAGYASIQFKVLSASESTCNLDLLKLQVDSVLIDSMGITSNLVYSYNDTLIRVVLKRNYITNDSFTLRIYYHGKPPGDASGWGGFYFSPPYAFNLGVGFDANPHSYGRAWFPCYDDFNTKCTFTFSISVDSGYTAIANGLRSKVSHVGGKSIFNYELKQPIPAYLACVAVAPYTFFQSQYNGIPVEIAALPKDTANSRILFKNLNSAMSGFEEAYGPYLFNKIGYSLVPFNGGAMEHATNIALPVSSADGSTNSETLWAHELSHHWWGDNITCSTPGDMWLNEGWASYSEALFTEKVYGRQTYKNYVADNHLYVLQFAHIADKGYRALTGVPHEYVYGRTVYKKGADMVHSMRGIFGDSAFFAICKIFQSQFQFKSVSTQDLKNVASQVVSDTKLVDDFFDHWIQKPGFTHFELITQSNFQMGSQFENHLIVRQKTQGTLDLYQYVPVEITFFKSPTEYITTQTIIKGYETDVVYTTDFIPLYICIDYQEKLSDAITDDHQLFNSKTDTLDFANGKIKLYIHDHKDTSLIRVEHHWVGPDGVVKTPGLYLHPYRYWSVGGIWSPSLKADARILYNGQSSNNDGYLDDQLLRITEDSLVLLYRETPSDDWERYPDYTKFMQNVNDKKGNILIRNIKKGDYCLAMQDKKLLLDESISNKTGLFGIYPNPAQGSVHIDFTESYENKQVYIYTSEGQLLFDQVVSSKTNHVDIPLSYKGVAVVQIYVGEVAQTKKIVLN